MECLVFLWLLNAYMLLSGARTVNDVHYLEDKPFPSLVSLFASVYLGSNE